MSSNNLYPITCIIPVHTLLCVFFYCDIMIITEMKSSLDSEETGPNRNSADFRIKKAQVCMRLAILNCEL